MLILCPSCATSYDVELASLQPNGRKVRCIRCRTVWHAEPTRAEMLLAAAGAIASPGHDVAQDTTRASAEERSVQPAAGHPAVAANEAEGPNLPADTPTADGQSLAASAESDLALVAPESSDPADAPGRHVEVEAPPIAPVDLDESQTPIDVERDHGDEPAEDIETYAARRLRRGAGRQSLRWPLTHLQNGILALLIANAVVIGWRNDFVRILPQTASFYAMLGLPVNLRGLVFEGITTTTEQHDGVPILVVEGNIVNDTRKIVDVPRLKFAARNPAREEIYSWTAVSPRTTLPPGETVSFRTRLASPPQEVRDVLVRFVNRRDVLGGAR
jgi:predicted Zn finger-like uncharacterized protein